MKKIRVLSLVIISLGVLLISAGCQQPPTAPEGQPAEKPPLPTQAVEPVQPLSPEETALPEQPLPPTGADEPEQPKKPPLAGIANPASTYCVNAGYELELRQDDQGNQYGVCIFPDGNECEEWKFFRGECGQENSYCVKQGNKLEIRDKLLLCVFSDGSVCVESDYAAGNCAPGMTPAAP